MILQPHSATLPEDVLTLTYNRGAQEGSLSRLGHDEVIIWMLYKIRGFFSLKEIFVGL